MNLANTIKLNREKKGLTQDDLAKKLGMTKQSVSFWETNRSKPSISVIPQMEKILGIELMSLYDDNIVSEPSENYTTKIDYVIAELEKISRQNSEILEYYMDLVKENFKYQSISKKLLEESKSHDLPEKITYLIQELQSVS
jgi:transcriptional regulator with XRE-family HTH domain